MFMMDEIRRLLHLLKTVPVSEISSEDLTRIHQIAQEARDEWEKRHREINSPNDEDDKDD